MHGSLMDVEWILTFYNNCIFPYYGKCLAISCVDSGKIHAIELGISIV